MNWIANFVRPRIKGLMRSATADTLWRKCTGCGEMVFHRDLVAAQNVCPQCGHHMRIGAKERFAKLFDDGAHEVLPYPEVSQDPLRFRDDKRYSERLKEYRARTTQTDALLAARGLLYPCFCTRKDIAAEIARAGSAPHGPDGPSYPGTCRDLSLPERDDRLARGAPYALRLDVGKAKAAAAASLSFEEEGAGPLGETGTQIIRADLLSDIVLARKGLQTSYHLAVVVDDALQGVTLVTRGNDLFHATHIQRLLQACLGLEPPRYAHHRLILDAKGRKFSKRDTAVTLASLRQNGVSVDEIRRLIGI